MCTDWMEEFSLTVRKAGVVGAGTMGQGIAEMLAYNGLDVHIIENSNEQLAHAIAMIEQSLDKQMEHGR